MEKTTNLPAKPEAQLENLSDFGATVAARAILRAAKSPQERTDLAARFYEVRRMLSGSEGDPLLLVLGERMALSWLQTCCEDVEDHDQELQTRYRKDDRYQVRGHRAQRRLLETARTMAYVRRMLSGGSKAPEPDPEADLPSLLSGAAPPM